MALFWRIWAAVTLVNLAVLTIFVGLATLQFVNINTGLLGGRLTVLAERTAAPFKAAARIGLPLSTVRNANALLERARQTDDAIRAIHVFDADRRIIHSTESPTPTAIPQAAANAGPSERGEPWHVESREGFLSIIEILGRDGRAAGGIVIVYPTAGSMTQVRAMGAELAVAAVMVVLAAAGLSGFLLRLGLRQQIQMFETVDGDIAEFERESWRSAAAIRADRVASASEGSELRRLLDAAEESYRAAGQTIASAGTPEQ